MNKQFYVFFATIMLVVSIPFQLLSAGGVGKQVQMHVNNLDNALSIDILEEALLNLKQTSQDDQTLNAKNREHILSYLRNVRYHPEKDYSFILQAKNEREIAKVVKDSYDSLIRSGVPIDYAYGFLERAEGRIYNYKKPVVLKHLHRKYTSSAPSRATEAQKVIKTDPTIDKWRTKPSVTKPTRGTTGFAGQLPAETKAETITKAHAKTAALPTSTASKTVKPLLKKKLVKKSKEAQPAPARAHEYKKSPKQIRKEKKERAEKKAKKRAVRAKRLKELKTKVSSQ